ncbi:hypothetical protein IFR05_014844 [Cadophora sp. M221]|nr:hypothetical protein IFR05_014844 [Cadophora sp. M221]
MPLSRSKAHKMASAAEVPPPANKKPKETSLFIPQLVVTILIPKLQNEIMDRLFQELGISHSKYSVKPAALAIQESNPDILNNMLFNRVFGANRTMGNLLRNSWIDELSVDMLRRGVKGYYNEGPLMLSSDYHVAVEVQVNKEAS